MKKIISIFLLLALLLSTLCACYNDGALDNGDNSGDNSDSGATDDGTTDGGNNDNGNTDNGTTDSDNTDNGGNEDTNTQGFDFYATLLSDYITLKDGMFTGMTLPGLEHRVDAITVESAKKYINHILLTQAALTKTQITHKYYNSTYTNSIEYGDEVFFYIRRVETADGKKVDVDYFENVEIGSIQIGMEKFGAEFDAQITGLLPMECFDLRTSGAVGANDDIFIRYTITQATSSTSQNSKNYRQERMALSEQNTVLRDKLLENFSAFGEYFSFEFMIDTNGNEITYLFEGVVDAVIENEKPYVLTATLPENYFDKSDDERLSSLNGTTLTFYVVIEHTVPHEVNTVETLDLADVSAINNFFAQNGIYPFVPTANQNGALDQLAKEIAALQQEIKQLTDSGKDANLSAPEAQLAEKEKRLEEALVTVRAELVTYVEAELVKTYETTVKKTKGEIVLAHLLETLDFHSLPEQPLQEYVEYLKDSLAYCYSLLSDLEKSEYRDMDQFAALAFFVYDEGKYATAEQYINEYLAPNYIKGQLLQAGIYNICIKDQNESKLNVKIDALLEQYIEYYKIAYGVTYTKEELNAAFAQDNSPTYLRDAAIYELVIEYLADNNTVDWDAAKIAK